MIKELQNETIEEDSIKNERSSIEEDIILLKDFTEGNFKRDKLENYKGSYKMGCFYYKDIQRAIEHIISDYKRVLKENEILKKEKEQAWEEWNNLEQGSYETEQKLKQQIKKLQEEKIRNSIPIQKVKDKIEEEKLPLIIVGGRRNKKTLEYGIQLGRRQILQELLESEGKKC